MSFFGVSLSSLAQTFEAVGNIVAPPPEGMDEFERELLADEFGSDSHEGEIQSTPEAARKTDNFQPQAADFGIRDQRPQAARANFDTSSPSEALEAQNQLNLTSHDISMAAEHSVLSNASLEDVPLDGSNGSMAAHPNDTWPGHTFGRDDTGSILSPISATSPQPYDHGIANRNGDASLGFPSAHQAREKATSPLSTFSEVDLDDTEEVTRSSVDGVSQSIATPRNSVGTTFSGIELEKSVQVKYRDQLEDQLAAYESRIALLEADNVSYMQTINHLRASAATRQQSTNDSYENDTTQRATMGDGDGSLSAEEVGEDTVSLLTKELLSCREELSHERVLAQGLMSSVTQHQAAWRSAQSDAETAVAAQRALESQLAALQNQLDSSREHQQAAMNQHLVDKQQVIDTINIQLIAERQMVEQLQAKVISLQRLDHKPDRLQVESPEAATIDRDGKTTAESQTETKEESRMFERQAIALQQALNAVAAALGATEVDLSNHEGLSAVGQHLIEIVTALQKSVTESEASGNALRDYCNKKAEEVGRLAGELDASLSRLQAVEGQLREAEQSRDASLHQDQAHGAQITARLTAAEEAKSAAEVALSEARANLKKLDTENRQYQVVIQQLRQVRKITKEDVDSIAAEKEALQARADTQAAEIARLGAQVATLGALTERVAQHDHESTALRLRINELESLLQQEQNNLVAVEKLNYEKELEADVLKADLLLARQDLEQRGIELANLYSALTQLEHDKEVARTRMQEDLEARRKQLEHQFSEALSHREEAWKSDLAVLRLQNKSLEAQAQDEALLRRKSEMDLVAEKRKMQKTLNEAIEQLKNSQEDVVDRTLIANLVVSYFQRKRSLDVLDLIARVLVFNDDQKIAVGLKPAPLASIVTNIYSTLVGGPPKVVEVEGDNLAEILVNLLLQETEAVEERNKAQLKQRSGEVSMPSSPVSTSSAGSRSSSFSSIGSGVANSNYTSADGGKERHPMASALGLSVEIPRSSRSSSEANSDSGDMYLPVESPTYFHANTKSADVIDSAARR